MSAGDTNIAAAEAVPAKAPPKAPAAGRSRDARPWLLLPAVSAVLIVSLLPMGYALFLSLQQAPSGFEELRADPRFWQAVRHTFVLASVALPVELLLGLALAGLFVGPMPGKTIFVSLLALPASPPSGSSSTGRARR